MCCHSQKINNLCHIDCNMHCLLFCVLQYADPVTDLLDKHETFDCRLFRESCVFHKGSYVKVCLCFLL